MSADDSDIEALLASTEALFPDATKELERSFDLWDDQGFWLAFLLLPIILASFRKGNIAVIVLVPLLFADPVSALEWQDLWKTDDQQASKALDAGDATTAQGLFKDREWRGSAAYKAGDYESAINDFLDFDSADAHYNRGNALAHTGDLEAAIEAYDQALALDPGMEDAEANKELLEQLKQQQEQQEGSESQQQSQEQQDSESQDSQSQEQQEGSESQEQSQEQQQASEDQQDQQPPQQASEQQQEPQSEEQNKEQSEEQNKEQSEEQSEEDKQAQQELDQWLRRVQINQVGCLGEKFAFQPRRPALRNPAQKPPIIDKKNAGRKYCRLKYLPGEKSF